MWFFKRIISIAIFTICSSFATGQTFSGTSFGYTFGLPLSISRDAGLVNRYGKETQGTSYEHIYGFGVRVFSYDVFSPRYGLSADLAFLLSNGRFTADPFIFTSVLDPASGQNVQPLYSYDVVSNLSLLKINTDFHFPFLKDFSAGFGVWGQYLLNSGFYQIEKLLNYERIQFENGQRTRAINAGDRLADNGFRFGPQFNINHILQYNELIHLQTTIGTSLDIRSVFDGVGIGAFKFMAGISLLFKINSQGNITPEQEFPFIENNNNKLSVTVFKKKYNAELHSFLEGMEEHHAEYKRITVYNKRMTVFSKELFLKENPYQLLKKLLPGETTNFTEGHLLKATQEEIHQNILNILGLRLKENPQFRLVLKPTSLLKSDAFSAQQYLLHVWGIETKRIEIIEQPNSTNPSLKLSSLNEGLFAPLEHEWIEQSYEMSPLKLIHNFSSTDSIQKWKMKIIGKEAELAYQQGTTLDELHEAKLDITFSGKTSPDSLILLLEAENSQGETLTARDTIFLKESVEKKYSLKEIFIPVSEAVSDTFLKKLKGEFDDVDSIEIQYPATSKDSVKNNLNKLWSAFNENIFKTGVYTSFKKIPGRGKEIKLILKAQ